MSESVLKVGCRVSVPAKAVKGTVEYIGTTAFAQGKWIGINLDEPKGKNNGTVKDKQYFKCQENYGMFVRQNQLIVLDENDSPILDLTEESTPKSKFASKLSSSRQSLSSVASSTSREDLTASTQSLLSHTPSASKRTSSFIEKTPTSKLPKQIPSASKTTKVSTAQKQTSARRSLTHSKENISNTNEQTGFVETLKPQFTPGQVMLSPSQPGSLSHSGSTFNINATGAITNVGILQQEIESLKDQLKDMTEKCETLKVKRVQDKEKLKDFDKIKIQLEQMVEFKSKIMESQAALQRELQLAKKEARDAIEAKNLHAEEMSDLAETVEMATLDKEMAEEKAESLQLELQEVKDKLEEITLDYDTLKAELEGSDNKEGVLKERTSYEFKQLEQQNARLRDTIVKMRDMIAHDKHEYQKLQKDLDQTKSEVAELSRTKEKLSSMVETLEEQIADLQEQVDAALGAEELVETLVNDKMALQEKVSELEEEISDLDAIKDTNDQLLEAQKESEIELREELDKALNTIRETQREKDAVLENLNDCQNTIQKFRELVAKLQEQLQDLQGKLDEEAKKPVGIPEMLDFQKVFTETKAHKRAIDLELRQIELSQMENHIQLLTAFMPESFLNRGGDHDAILLLLVIPRLLCKCEIILSQINCKFPKIENIHKESVLKEDGVVQYSCRCRLSYFLYRSQMILRQFIHSLDTCSTETLLKGGGKYVEIAVQEKIIDSYIESVKKDVLDENVMIEPLEKFVAYFDAMYGFLFENETGKIHHSHCIKDATQALNSSCESILTDCLAIQAIYSNREPTGEIILIVQFTAASFEHCLAQLKNIRRKIPNNESNLNISTTLLMKLINVTQVVGRIVKMIQEVFKNARQFILLYGEQGKEIGNAKLEELFQQAVDKYLETDEASPVDSVKKEITSIVNVIAEFYNLVEKVDFDLISPSNDKAPEKPIVIRATAVKKELDETKILAKKLENKEMDIKDLKMALKAKQEEFSEMCIRKELVEKKLFNFNKDHESETVKLRNELEEVKKEAKKKEKEFEIAMDHLSADIEELEKERKELREKLKGHSRKFSNDSPTKTEAAVSNSSKPDKISWDKNESEGLHCEVEELKSSLKQISMEYLKLKNNFNRKQLLDLPPLPLFENQSGINKNSKKIFNELWKEGQDLQKQVFNNLVFEIPDFTKIKPGESMDSSAFLLKQFNRRNEVQKRIDNFVLKVNEQIIKMTKGGHIDTLLTVFPTPEMKKALSETEPLPIGELKIPSTRKESKDISLTVNLQSLREIQNKILVLAV